MSPLSRRTFLKRTAAGAGALSLPRTPISYAQTETNRRPLGYAVVGIGQLARGEVIPAFTQTQHSRLIGFVSGDPQKAARFARQYGVPEKNIYNYQNYGRMASNPDIDAIYIALPNNMHAEYTIRAAQAGKHVLCEKPMANSARDCEEMIEACRHAGKKLMVAYRLQYEPNNLEAARMARSGELGKVKLIEAQFAFIIGDPTQWRLKKAMSGGGPLVDIGIYCIQAAQYLSGEEPVSVAAHAWSTDPVKFREVEENISFTLHFPSGLAANCYSSYGLNGINEYRAVGPKGGVEMGPAYSYRDLRLRAWKRPHAPEDRTLPEQNQFAAEIDRFSLDIAENRNPKASGDMGLRDVKIITAIYQAGESGGTVKIR